MPQPARPTKAGQREAMVRTLIEIGRDVFARSGYAQASAEDIVRRAGVTRGALYHHFDGKQGLFRAVLDAVQHDVARSVEAAADRAGDPWQQLVAGCRAFLTATSDPATQRIMLVDAPAVLGWELWRQMDAQYSMRLLSQALDELVAERLIVELPIEALTHLLSGAMNEAALWIARSTDQPRALEQALLALDHLLGSLRRPAT